jgi:hypothetical protein
LIAAAAVFQSLAVRCVGYDLDEKLLEKARVAAANLKEPDSGDGQSQPCKLAPSPTIDFRFQDLLTADVSSASVVVAYLFREGCILVQEKLERELPSKGTYVLSVGFAMKGWEARWVIKPKGSVPLYFYSPVRRECPQHCYDASNLFGCCGFQPWRRHSTSNLSAISAETAP